jgi:hypothetical protein
VVIREREKKQNRKKQNVPFFSPDQPHFLAWSSGPLSRLLERGHRIAPA